MKNHIISMISASFYFLRLIWRLTTFEIRKQISRYYLLFKSNCAYTPIFYSQRSYKLYLNFHNGFPSNINLIQNLLHWNETFFKIKKDEYMSTWTFNLVISYLYLFCQWFYSKITEAHFSHFCCCNGSSFLLTKQCK